MIPTVGDRMDFGKDTDLIRQIVQERDPSFGDVDSGALSRDFYELDSLQNADSYLLSAMRLLARSGNGHTRIIPNGAINILPLRFVAIGSGTYLTSAPTEMSEQLDQALVAVNDIPIAKVYEKLRPFLAGTLQRQRVIGTLPLAWPAALERVGVSTGKPVTKYTFNGTHADQTNLLVNHANTCLASDLYPVAEKGRLDPAASPNQSFVTAEKPAPDVLNFRFSDFFDPSGRALDGDIQKAAQILRQNTHRNLIFDLRGNPGGDFLKTLPYLRVLSKQWTGQKCAVLVNKFTFSAAIVFVVLVKDILNTKMALIGEGMGDDTRFYAEGGTVQLPQTGATLRYSEAFHDWKTGRADATTPQEIAAHLVAVGDLVPDIYTDISASDLRAGRDPQLESAIAFVTG